MLLAMLVLLNVVLNSDFSNMLIVVDFQGFGKSGGKMSPSV
jgi:hypothetical protein